MKERENKLSLGNPNLFYYPEEVENRETSLFRYLCDMGEQKM